MIDHTVGTKYVCGKRQAMLDKLREFLQNLENVGVTHSDHMIMNKPSLTTDDLITVDMRVTMNNYISCKGLVEETWVVKAVSIYRADIQSGIQSGRFVVKEQQGDQWVYPHDVFIRGYHHPGAHHRLSMVISLDACYTAMRRQAMPALMTLASCLARHNVPMDVISTCVLPKAADAHVATLQLARLRQTVSIRWW
jgi:hypothetical protein